MKNTSQKKHKKKNFKIFLGLLFGIYFWPQTINAICDPTPNPLIDPETSVSNADPSGLKSCNPGNVKIQINRASCFSTNLKIKEEQKKALKEPDGMEVNLDYESKLLTKNDLIRLASCLAKKRQQVAQKYYEEKRKELMNNDLTKKITELKSKKDIKEKEKQRLEKEEKKTLGKQAEIESLTREITQLETELVPLLAERTKTEKQINGCYLACVNWATKESSKITLTALSEETDHFDVGKFLNVGEEKKITLMEDNKETGEKSFLQKLIKTAMQIIGTLGIIMLMIGGIFMITAGGKDNQLQKGKNIFIFTIMGLAIAFLSYIIVNFIISFVFFLG